MEVFEEISGLILARVSDAIKELGGPTHLRVTVWPAPPELDEAVVVGYIDGEADVDREDRFVFASFTITKSDLAESAENFRKVIQFRYGAALADLRDLLREKGWKLKPWPQVKDRT